MANGMSDLQLYSRPKSTVTATWLAFISHPIEDRWLSLPGWLVTYQGSIPASSNQSQC